MTSERLSRRAAVAWALAGLATASALGAAAGCRAAAGPTTGSLPQVLATAAQGSGSAEQPNRVAEEPPSPGATDAGGGAQGGPIEAAEAEPYGYRVIAEYPHDPEAWTQGLVYTDGLMYEGTGLEGRSSLRKVDLASGEVRQAIDLAPELFGEGIAVWGDRVVQITWRNRAGFVYDKETLESLDDWSYSTEGWGLTHDGRRLIMSDGTSTLYFRDPETFEIVGTVEVTEGGRPLDRLNELEYVNGKVYANVWLTDRVVIIDPDTGVVRAGIDFSGLLSPEDSPGADVLNGIAYDPVESRLFVTGKLWPKLFEVELVPPGVTLNLLPLVMNRT